MNGKKLYYYNYYIYNKEKNENDYLQIEEEYLNGKANPNLIVKIFIENILKFIGDYLYEKKLKKFFVIINLDFTKDILQEMEKNILIMVNCILKENI